MLTLLNSYLLEIKTGGISVNIVRASLEMVLKPLEIFKRNIVCKENKLLSAAFVRLLPLIAASKVIMFSTIVEYQIFSIWVFIPQDLVAHFAEL